MEAVQAYRKLEKENANDGKSLLKDEDGPVNMMINAVKYSPGVPRRSMRM